MKTVTGKLYSGLVSLAVALTPSVSYGHNPSVVDDLGRIVGQTCGDGDELFMEARVLYNGDGRVPVGVVAENFGKQRKETVMYFPTNEQRVVTIEDMITPTTFSGDFTDKKEFKCKKGKAYCTTDGGYTKLPVGFVKNEAGKPVQTFTCQKGKQTCVSEAGYRIPLSYVQHKAEQSFQLFNQALRQSQGQLELKLIPEGKAVPQG